MIPILFISIDFLKLICIFELENPLSHVADRINELPEMPGMLPYCFGMLPEAFGQMPFRFGQVP